MAFFQKKRKKYVKGMISGEAKSGKTHLMINLSHSEIYGPVCIIDMEDGVKYDESLLGEGSEVVQVESNVELMLVLKKLKSAGDDLPFKTIILDSITASWVKLMTSYSTIKQKKEAAKAKKQGYTIKKINNDVDAFDSQRAFAVNDWGAIKMLNSKIVSTLFDLPCHKFVTSWVASEFSSDNKVIGVKSKAEKNIAYIVDFAVELVKNGNKRTLKAMFDRTKCFSKPKPATVKTLEEVALIVSSGGVEPLNVKKKVNLNKNDEDTMPCDECSEDTPIDILNKTEAKCGRGLCWECYREESK